MLTLQNGARLLYCIWKYSYKEYYSWLGFTKMEAKLFIFVKLDGHFFVFFHMIFITRKRKEKVTPDF
jgi:hypothetical protein